MLCNNLHQPLPCLYRSPRDMGRDEEPALILYSEERVIFCHWFHRENVQSGCLDFSGIECIGEIRFIYDGASAEIEKDSAGFHFPESVCVHDIFRILIEWGMDGEDIGLGEQSVKIYLPVAFLCRST